MVLRCYDEGGGLVGLLLGDKYYRDREVISFIEWVMLYL
jgi:hypothetical protein